MLTTSENRAAWDATISAPKSVSLAALVRGDGRIRDAYRESINETVKELEISAIARLEERQSSTPDYPPKRSRIRGQKRSQNSDADEPR
jgi:conjugative relaxase-like TrwC/TraI family protein